MARSPHSRLLVKKDWSSFCFALMNESLSARHKERSLTSLLLGDDSVPFISHVELFSSSLSVALSGFEAGVASPLA